MGAEKLSAYTSNSPLKNTTDTFSSSVSGIVETLSEVIDLPKKRIRDMRGRFMSAEWKSSMLDGRGIVRHKKTGLYGLADEKGKVFTDCIYQQITRSEDGVYRAIRQDNTLVVIEPRTGKEEVLEVENKHRTTEEDIRQDKKDNFAVSSNDGKTYKRIDGMGPSNGLIPVQDEQTGLYGYMNSNEELVIRCQYLSVRSFSHGVAWVEVIAPQGKREWLIIDTNNMDQAPQVIEGVPQTDFDINGFSTIKDANGKMYTVNTKGIKVTMLKERTQKEKSLHTFSIVHSVRSAWRRIFNKVA